LKERPWSHVKAVDMEINPSVWIVIIGLKYIGSRVGKGNTGPIENYNISITTKSNSLKLVSKILMPQ